MGLMKCTVKYDKIDEQSGKEKTVTEPYLVDALSFTEAEERIHKEMETFISGEFEVKGITRENIAEVFIIEDTDKFYECTASFADIDEKSGKEKATKHKFVIGGNSTQNAEENLKDKLKDIITPWEMKRNAESKIMDIFLHENTGE